MLHIVFNRKVNLLLSPINLQVITQQSHSGVAKFMEHRHILLLIWRNCVFFRGEGGFARSPLAFCINCFLITGFRSDWDGEAVVMQR